MARAPNRFVDETLWPEFMELSKTLRNSLSDVIERIASQVICQDNFPVLSMYMMPYKQMHNVREMGTFTTFTWFSWRGPVRGA